MYGQHKKIKCKKQFVASIKYTQKIALKNSISRNGKSQLNFSEVFMCFLESRMALARQRNERGRTPTPAPTTIWPVAVKAPFFFVLLTVSCVLPVACWLLLCLSPSLSLSCASHLFHYTVTLCVCVYADFFVVIYLYFVLE